MSTAGRITYLYVNTANSSNEDTESISLIVPDAALQCSNNEYLRLSLVQFSIVNQIYNLSETGEFSMNNREYYIFPGIYKIGELLEYLNYRIQVQPVVLFLNEDLEEVRVTFRYNNYLNKIEIINSQGYSLTYKFNDILGRIFGFVPNVEYLSEDGFGPVLSAPTCVVPQPITELVVHLSDVLIDPPTNLINVPDNSLNTASIFGVVPLRARPGCLNVWTNLSDSYSVDIYDTNITKLSLRVSDSRGKTIAGLPHWSCVIKCEFLQRTAQDSVTETLGTILEYMKLFFLQQATLMND